MGRKRYTPDQIIGELRDAEVMQSKGPTAGQACRKLAVTERTYYNPH